MGKHRQFHDLGFSVGRLLATISEYVHSRLAHDCYAATVFSLLPTYESILSSNGFTHTLLS